MIFKTSIYKIRIISKLRRLNVLHYVIIHVQNYFKTCNFILSLFQLNDADADGDGVADVDDICPFDKKISSFGFKTSQLIDLARMALVRLSNSSLIF